MPLRTLTSTPAPSPAVLAFLRGIERRGAVFGELQSGNAVRGDAALGIAMAGFVAIATDLPVPQWPARFWALVLAAPPLREHGPTDRPLAFAPLAEVGSGPRAALLLRLVAGLAETEASAVLGIGRSTYRLALQRALPRLPDGHPDHAGWQAMGVSAQTAIRALPADRLAHLALLRDAAVRGKRLPQPMAMESGRSALGHGTAPAGRWRWLAIGAVAVLTVAALAATFFGRGAASPDEGPSQVEVAPLPAADAPAATLDAADALATDRDLQLLLVADMPAAATDPGFYAWLAARTAAGRAIDDIEPLAASERPDEAARLPESREQPSETDDAP